ncbi:efflux RND transporter periplasmic adaptor subunit [Synechococcus elongatus]|uniref:Efflux RND transporter periplasmic adaptor subunit n=1 Tax=Synechococcus elongatus PCC 11802 TaxID=2283154 RepID=A0AAT9JZ81_SYNEL|nr:efflux RND transporter periplasmic adaptor subunit [Synechococcus elongatus]QFZ91158.1 efflux RND transporter periplasmic adaptor subunit [Synechococcus elongatus PCC 11802]
MKNSKSLLSQHSFPFLLGVVLALPIFSTSCRPVPEADAQTPSIATEIITLQTNLTKNSTEFVGSLEAAQIAEVRPEIQGRVERITVSPGQSVDVGRSLLVLKADETLPQLQGSLAALDVAIGGRENALKALDIARAQRDTARSDLNLKIINTKRVQQLVADGALAQIYLDEVLAKQDAARNSLKAAEEQVAAAQVAITQADAKIREARAQAQSSGVSLGFKNVVAPIAGVVDDILVKVGDYVTTGQPVTRITQTDIFYLNIEVPAENANQLKTGLAVELLDPSNRQYLATGSLVFISPTVQSNAQGILIKAQFQNVNSKLRDGQFVAARLIWGVQPGILVPTGAISRISGKSFVFIVDKKPNQKGQLVVRLQPVELGPIQGNQYQIKSGLRTGDRIAVTNVLRLRDGAVIQSQN